ncbi:hypothetical protein [Escherichia coli]|uniref:hypothetical protein n=1 Tax=Escherichia coli TaxID=562 RepID=UPI00106D9DD8|nr:hypothetical protein [Escherichia coli]EIH9537428.1 hypothetical protein [Escherichia coli]VFS85548.1 Uncharacterised protein [Escherichia coli]HAI2335039.1 hypothetical protein [Escherichia coli]
MSNSRKENIKQLVARLKDVKERSGFAVPEWMLDEGRYDKDALTPEEQMEWAETIVPHVRASTALLYLIECDKRWGLREGKYQFKNGEHVFEITQQLIESVLIKYVEEELIAHKPQERYIAVYQFYHSNDSQVRENGQSWFNQFLDDMFIDLAARLRAGGELPVKPIVH